MLRVATMEDLELVVTHCLNFVKTTNYKDYADEDRIRNLVRNFINSDRRERIVFLYGDVGMLAAFTNELLLGGGKVATELVWWVDPSARGTEAGLELLKTFETWAKETNCDMVTVTCLDEPVAKFYEKNDYKLYEKAYIKEI